MDARFFQRLRTLPHGKAIAIAIYGESVAAYRYGVLVEKALTPEHKKVFTQMQDEERGHQQALEKLAQVYFPDDDFVLAPEDKDLVIVGNRMLQVTDRASFLKAMQFLHGTENRTGEFYTILHEMMPEGQLGSFLEQMAAECFVHGESLLAIEPPPPDTGD